MLTLLIHLSWIFGCTYILSLCTKKKEEKSEGRMPGSVQVESLPVKNGSSSFTASASAEGTKHPLRKRRLLWDRKRKFSKEENEKRSESAPDRKSSDEKTDRKTEEKEKKEKQEKQDFTKESEKKDRKAIEAASCTPKEKTETEVETKRSVRETAQKEARTQVENLSAKKAPSYREVTALPEDTLALLAAAEQMTLDKGDYDNFGPPAQK
ncbi:hypothetical protein RB195_016461 [Necator americanus]